MNISIPLGILALLSIQTLASYAQSLSTTSTARSTPPDNEAWNSTYRGTSTLAPTLSDIGQLPASFLGALHPSANYSLQYGDGIPSQLQRSEKTAIHRLTPRLLARFAERIEIVYSPTFIWFSNNFFKDGIDHSALLKGNLSIGETNFKLSQSYNRTLTPLFETSLQTEQEVWDTTISADLPLGPQTNINTNFSYQQRTAVSFTDIETLSGFVFLQRSLDSRLNISVGAGVTQNSIDPGADLTSRQLISGLTWIPSARVSVKAELGADQTKFSGGAEDWTSSPLYGLSATYQLAERSQISIGARRAVNASYFSDNYVERTTFNLTISQRLLENYTLSISATGSEFQYITRSKNAGSDDRKDKLTRITANLGRQISPRLTASLTYQYNQQDSNKLGFTSKIELIGISVDWIL